MKKIFIKSNGRGFNSISDACLIINKVGGIMNIDKNLLTNDLRRLRSYVENDRKDDIKYEYARLYWFNETCIDLFDLGYEDVDLTEQDYEMKDCLKRKKKENY